MSAGKTRYEILPGLLLGFHGADQDTAERVLAGKEHLKPSKNSYDWLGHGIYFWEYSPQRAFEFATQAAQDRKLTKGKVFEPAVIGAVIDPGRCLNLLEASALAQLKQAYEALTCLDTPPKNVGGIDKLRRHLDCAVIEMLHAIRRQPDQKTGAMLPDYQTVRGAFWEGDVLYPEAGFREKNHVQLVVRDTACIKGYFRPIID
jgi:hypothetical protein